MRSFIHFALLLLFIGSATAPAFSQKADATTTIIIVRHAEKEQGDNPPLSAVGTSRAEKLPAKFPALKPDAIYSTPYVRTQQTAAPWAKQAALPVQTYDPRNLPEFADMLKKQTGKSIIVIGHSNTNPQLVNLLLNEDTYNSLPDSDYDTIYEVTIKKDKTKVKVIH